jgi:hypothetical protein
MTLLTDLFLKQLRNNAQITSGSLTRPTTFQMTNGQDSDDASSTTLFPEKAMTTLPKSVLKGKTAETFGYAVGSVVGLIAAATATILLGAWAIHWILTAVGIGTLTYTQIVGLLAIWEIIKPRSNSK